MMLDRMFLAGNYKLMGGDNRQLSLTGRIQCRSCYLVMANEIEKTLFGRAMMRCKKKRNQHMVKTFEK